MASTDFEASAAFIGSLVKAGKELGWYDAVRAKVKAETGAALDDPSSKSWWPSGVLEDFVVQLAALRGEKAVHDVSRVSAHRTMGGIVKPLISVTLAVFGASPGTLASRLSTFVGVGLRGLSFEWKPEGKTAGVVVAMWPRPVPPEMSGLWYGLFDFAFSVTTPGRVSRAVIEAQRHTFELRW